MLTFLLSEFKTWFTAADDSGQGMFLCSACVAFISVESNFLVSFTCILLLVGIVITALVWACAA